MRSFLLLLVLAAIPMAAFAQEAGHSSEMRRVPNYGPDLSLAAPMAQLPPHQVAPNQLREETAQLDELVKAVEPKLQQASQGALDKDLLNKLKAIEKLAKKLRSELNN